MDLREIGWEGVEWIHLAQDRDRWRAVVNAVMNHRALAPHSSLDSRHELVFHLFHHTGIRQAVTSVHPLARFPSNYTFRI
jgi:hypothetical protein